MKINSAKKNMARPVLSVSDSMVAPAKSGLGLFLEVLDEGDNFELPVYVMSIGNYQS